MVSQSGLELPRVQCQRCFAGVRVEAGCNTVDTFTKTDRLDFEKKGPQHDCLTGHYRRSEQPESEFFSNTGEWSSRHVSLLHRPRCLACAVPSRQGSARRESAIIVQVKLHLPQTSIFRRRKDGQPATCVAFLDACSLCKSLYTIHMCLADPHRTRQTASPTSAHGLLLSPRPYA
jgi:hypothetical protein